MCRKLSLTFIRFRLLRLQIEQLHHRADERISRGDGTRAERLHGVWPIPGSRGSKCDGQPQVRWQRPSAGQICHCAVSRDRLHELLRAGCLRPRFIEFLCNITPCIFLLAIVAVYVVPCRQAVPWISPGEWCVSFASNKLLACFLLLLCSLDSFFCVFGLNTISFCFRLCITYYVFRC